MHRIFTAVALAVFASLSGPWAPVRAQQAAPDQQPQGIMPMSQFLQQAGFSLDPAEATYLDEDQAVQIQYVGPLFEMFGLAGSEQSGLPDGETQEKIVAALQTVLALDPNAAPQAPPSLARLRELAVEQRAALRRAAAGWLSALQAGDENWRQGGADDFSAAQQSLGAWNQEMFTRYPPPEQPPS
jgi:hypothetical protein